MANIPPASSPADLKYNEFFDDVDADVIVRSGDGALFRMYKVILSKASSIFKDTFGMPQSPAIVDGRDHIDGLPVVDVTEDERTLQILFRTSYPVKRPELIDLDDIARLLKAAIKYEMDMVAEWARGQWPTAVTKDPLRAFAVACSRGLNDEAVFAARLALRQPIWPLEPPLAPEFKRISADTFVRLESFQRKCGAVCVRWASDAGHCARLYDHSRCGHCQAHGDATTSQSARMRDWFSAYMKRASTALALRPAGSTILDAEMMAHAFHDANKDRAESDICSLSTHEFELMQQAMQNFAREIDDLIRTVSQVSDNGRLIDH